MVDCLGIVVSSHCNYDALDRVEEYAQRIRDILGVAGLSQVPVKVQHELSDNNVLRDLYQDASSGA